MTGFKDGLNSDQCSRPEVEVNSGGNDAASLLSDNPTTAQSEVRTQHLPSLGNLSIPSRRTTPARLSQTNYHTPFHHAPDPHMMPSDASMRRFPTLPSGKQSSGGPNVSLLAASAFPRHMAYNVDRSSTMDILQMASDMTSDSRP